MPKAKPHQLRTRSRPRSSTRRARPAAAPPRLTPTLALLEAVFRGAGVGLCLLNSKDSIVRVNPEWLAATGFSADEVLGHTIWDLLPMPKEDVDGLVRLNERVRAGNSMPLPAVRLELRGREVWLEGRAAPVPLEDGPGVLVTLHEITKQKQIEQALRQAEQRFRLALRNAPVSVAAMDKDLRYLWHYGQLIGGTEGALGKTDAEICPPDDAARLTVIKRTVLEENVEVRSEGWFTTAAGRLYLDCFFEPIHDEHGKVVGVGSASMDLTAMKLAEEAVREREERLAVTLRSIGDAVIATDERGQITLINAEAERLTGWPGAQAIGRPVEEIFRIVKEDSRAVALSPADRVLREGAVVSVADNTVLLARDGTEHPIADSGAPIRDAAGRTAGVVLVFRDQTFEREAERKLRRSEERLRLALEATDAGIWEWDRVTGEEVWSDGVWRLYGMEPGGRKPSFELWMSTVHPEDAAGVSAVIDEAARIGSEYEVEWRVADPRRGIRWLTSRGRPVREPDGTVSRYRGIVLDTTAHKQADEARRKLEDQLQQAQKLESVGRLAGGVAHDFNNLLTVILSCVESLDEAVSSGRPADVGEIDEIRSAGRRAGELTRQLLAFARKQLITPVPLDLGAVVLESEKLLRRVLGEHIELRVNVAPGLWLVCCDTGQMEQVVVNLAVNARDAMPQGGQLWVELENAVSVEGTPAFASAAPGDYVRLRVKDTGVGMSPEVMTHLYEPFFTTKPRGSGTGLGLATTYGIVRQSGGGIHVESAPGHGTTFAVYFPRTVQPAPVPVPPRPGAGGGTEAVLVVEDDALVREITVRALRSGGYDVTVAEHPQQALDLPVERLRKMYLLVTDVVMPGLDGRALADELLGRHPPLRVLFVSGYTQDALAERGVMDSGIEFLPKPFTPAMLLGRVREVLDAAPSAGQPAPVGRVREELSG